MHYPQEVTNTVAQCKKYFYFPELIHVFTEMCSLSPNKLAKRSLKSISRKEGRER